MESNINHFFISYDLKSKNISKLSQEQQNFYIENIKNQLNNSINDYNSKNLSEQDNILFGFSDESLNSENKNKNLTSTIQEMIENIEEGENYTFFKKQKIELKNMDKGIYNISYIEICAIVNLIIFILKSIPKKKKEKLYYNFYFKGEIPNNKLEFNGISINKIKINMDSIKQLNICISDKKSNIEIKNSNEIDLYVIKFFFLFFKNFFRNVLRLNIDLNIYEINNYLNKENNPYKIKENRIIKLSKYVENIFLANLIIINNLKKFTEVTTIKYILYDSYQIELYQLMINFFSKNSEQQNNNIKNNNNSNNINNEKKEEPAFRNKILFFDHIIIKRIKDYFDFKFDINSLDPLLFSYMNLLLHRYTSLMNTTINFFVFDNINIRKTLLNAYNYNLYLKQNEKDIINPLLLKYYPEKINEKFMNDYKIYYNQINRLDEFKNKLIIRDEEIINELFPYFNYNINMFFFVLLEKFRSDINVINSLSLNFRSINDNIINLQSSYKYNIAIITFLFNLFNEIENNKNLLYLCSLEINLDDISDNGEYIIKDILKKFRNNLSFNFEKINLTLLKLDIPNITIFLPFQNFPSNNLKHLVLKSLTINDLDNITSALLNNKPIFKKLNTFDISISYMLNDFKKYIKILLKENICPKLMNFNLTIPFSINNNDIIDILSWIKNAGNKKSIIYLLKISNDYLNNHAGNSSFNDAIINFYENIKKNLQKKNLIIIDKKSITNRSFKMNIKMLDIDEINYFLKFIFCFNKTYEKKGNNNIIGEKYNKTIYENIFYYMGKFGKKDKEIIFEII